jgi:hypothetical protein
MYMTPAFHMWTHIDGWDLGRPENLLHPKTFLLSQFPPRSLDHCLYSARVLLKYTDLLKK